MIISPAYAEDTPATTATTETPGSAPAGMAGAPSDTESLMMNIGMLVVLGVMFYLLLVRPQQKRFKEHASMLNKLDKGSKIVTQGGLVGTIEKVVSDHEIQIDLGNGVKVTMMRSYIMGRYEDSLPTGGAANDDTANKKNKKG